VKKLNRILFSGLGLSMLLLLSGCVQVKDGKPAGFVWDIIGRPMSLAIQYFANNMGLGFGVAIIIVTLIVRLIILPLGLYQSWKSTYQSEKMNYLKPIFEPIQERMKNAETQEEKLAAQQALMAAQKENGLSMFGGIGCLPLLIQMPFFSALFFAAQYTQGVAGSSFLWIKDLAKSDWALTAIVGILYYIQSVLSLHGIEDETQREIDIEEVSKENTLRGIFVKKILEKKEKETNPAEKEKLDNAIELVLTEMRDSYENR